MGSRRKIHMSDRKKIKISTRFVFESESNVRMYAHAIPIYAIAFDDIFLHTNKHEYDDHECVRTNTQNTIVSIKMCERKHIFNSRVICIRFHYVSHFFSLLLPIHHLISIFEWILVYSLGITFPYAQVLHSFFFDVQDFLSRIICILHSAHIIVRSRLCWWFFFRLMLFLLSYIYIIIIVDVYLLYCVAPSFSVHIAFINTFAPGSLVTQKKKYYCKI